MSLRHLGENGSACRGKDSEGGQPCAVNGLVSYNLVRELAAQVKRRSIDDDTERREKCSPNPASAGYSILNGRRNSSKNWIPEQIRRKDRALLLRFEQAVDEPALEEDDHQHRREKRHHRRRHDEVPFGKLRPVGTVEAMPTTTTRMLSELVAISGQRYWFQP